MKTRYKLLFSVLLVWAQVFAPSLTGRAGGGSALMAQEAFYIYRNDGDFDGFFYDQVVRMGYSKYDLDSIEHDVYVVQEVETTDSIYRIPLAAIDSIGFQQPEIILNPKLKDLDKLGLSDYVTNVMVNEGSRGYMYISPSAPADKIPKVGDVICSFTNPKFRSDGQTEDDFSGFAGKVSQVYTAIYHNNDYFVAFQPCTELSDIFVQFISVEQVGIDEGGNVRRRLAGFNEDGTLKTKRRSYDGESETTLLNLSGTIKREWEPKKGVNLSMDLGYSMKVYLNVTYQMTWRRVLVKTSCGADLDFTPGLGVKSSVGFNYEVGDFAKFMKSIKFPANLPIFQTAPWPQIFLRGSGELGAKLTFPTKSFHLVNTILYDSDLDYIPLRWYLTKTPPPSHDNDAQLFDDTGGVDLSLSGFIQAGLKFSLNLSTNDWIDKIFFSKISMDLYCGPKLEGNFSYSSKYLDMPDFNLYGNFKDSNFKLTGMSVDFETKASAGILSYDPVERTFFDGNMSFLQDTLYLFPNFPDFWAETVDGTGIIRSYVKPERKVFWPSHVGIGLFDLQGNSIENKFDKNPWFFLSKKDKDYKFETEFAEVDPGIYNVRPVLTFMGKTIDTYERGRDVAVRPMLKHERPNQTDTIVIPAGLDSWTIPFKTNASDVRVYYANDLYHIPGELKISDPVEGSIDRILTFEMGMNNSYKKRKWDILLRGWTGNMLVEDTIHVIQDIKDNLFTHAIVRAYFKGGGTTHQWGNAPGVALPYITGQDTYDKTSNIDYGGYGMGVLKCSRQGDVFDCSGKYENSISSSGNSNTHESSSVSLTVDLSSPDNIRVLSGSFNKNQTSSSSSESGSHSDNTTVSGSWKYPIPFINATPRLNYWDDVTCNGWLHFRLDGKQAFSGSYSASATNTEIQNGKTYYDYVEASATADGEDGYVEIWVAY